MTDPCMPEDIAAGPEDGTLEALTAGAAAGKAALGGKGKATPSPQTLVLDATGGAGPR